MGGASRKAEWGTAGLRGGVQHTCCTAGRSEKHNTTHTGKKKIFIVPHIDCLLLFFMTVCCGHRIGHRAVDQSVRPAVQRVLPSVCLHRGRTRTLDPDTDSDPHRSR